MNNTYFLAQQALQQLILNQWSEKFFYVLYHYLVVFEDIYLSGAEYIVVLLSRDRAETITQRRDMKKTLKSRKLGSYY